jgi:DNA-binding response OmpR family regulator
VVEDEEDVTDLVTSALRDAGFEVSVASNGQDAYDRIVDELPDVVVTDTTLPGLDGYELCSRLREHPKAKSTCIIMMTTVGVPEDRVAGLRAGADDFVAKPFRSDELVERIREALVHSQEMAVVPPGPPPEAKPQISVLVVDDDAIMREVLRIYFEEAGFTVYEAQNGVLGYHLAVHHQPDFIVLDFKMPELDGKHAAELIQESVPNGRIVALSAYLDAKPAWAETWMPKHEIKELPKKLKDMAEKGAPGA